MNKLLPVLLVGFLGYASHARAQNVLCEIDDIAPEQVRVEGFRLDSEQTAKIHAVGFRDHEVTMTRAWILDAATRDLIWEMENAKKQTKSRRIVEFHDEITLPAGGYEVYYSSYPYHYKDNGWGRWLGDWFHDLFDGDKRDVYRHFKRDWQEFKIIIRGKGQRYTEEELQPLRQSFLRPAFVTMVNMRDHENERRGFKLKRPMEIQIYALGEARRDGTFDYGWLLDGDTREKVWKLDYHNSAYAGGARKNRLVNETIKLPAGKYLALYVTDDSHSSGRWNAAPPDDPHFWGLTMRVKQIDDLRNIEEYDFEEDRDQSKVVLAFTRLRDSEFRSQRIRCKKDVAVRVYAIGEGKPGEMFDYSWIIDARDHKKVWAMDYHNTEHAGGGKKNRMYDNVIKLSEGEYVVYCVTDGSHSYWDWNTAPPYDQEHWGITMFAANDTEPDNIVKVDERDGKAIIAQLIRVRNYEHERQRFTLDRDTNVRIYAVGEGARGGMFDYGWIENADNRKTVWEMTYRTTEHAGGAHKNRRYDGVIMLKAGEYLLHYKTDDSHSFEHWNDKPPYDPTHWGITLYRAQ